MNNPLKNRLPLIAFAALPLTIGLGFAQNSATTADTTAGITAQAQPGTQRNQTQGQQDRAARNATNHADTFLKNLATQLNTTPEKLKAAAVKAGNATIDAAVKAGDIPADRAADMKARLAENPFGFGGGRGHGMRGDHGPRDGQRGPRGQQPGAPAGNAGQDQGAAQQGSAADTSGT
ncbi:hypothetical protein CBQ26_05665 [Deinococcus indicus]|uniref:DUF2680 domain-containing protein n=1 Tax=Deinococcus indicus TaxID=223556 RepID=A0A246BPX5_9DEIO|nr:hypothetical protein [Deinococcus indicus]OWL97739.1 hypothetical protein CBQ26_05665 [Deinococcus indicus]GHG17651.1 hypothetical protein GCM10017784_05750 [Deinococcus indicus]